MFLRTLLIFVGKVIGRVFGDLKVLQNSKIYFGVYAETSSLLGGDCKIRVFNVLWRVLSAGLASYWIVAYHPTDSC
jgi:hypothetical protein